MVNAIVVSILFFITEGGEQRGRRNRTLKMSSSKNTVEKRVKRKKKTEKTGGKKYETEIVIRYRKERAILMINRERER